MATVAMATRGRSPSTDTPEDGAGKPKVLSSSPALSCISTVALSEVEVLEFSDDEDCGLDEPEAFQWCLVGSRIAPVFADMLHGNILEDGPIHEPQSAQPPLVVHDHDDAQWRHVGLRLAAVMKEAAEEDDAQDAKEEQDFCCRPELLHADADERSWRLVGLRLARLFSNMDCDGETTLPTVCADEAATIARVAVSSGEHPKESLLEAHERWHTVGSRLSTVLRTAEQ